LKVNDAVTKVKKTSSKDEIKKYVFSYKDEVFTLREIIDNTQLNRSTVQAIANRIMAQGDKDLAVMKVGNMLVIGGHQPMKKFKELLDAKQ